MSSAILFTNWSNEAFTHTWNQEKFTFQPGQSIYLQDYLARHFAKHLANRELLKQHNEALSIHASNEASVVFQEYLNRALSTPVESGSSLKSEIDELNLNEEIKVEKKKGGRPKKVTPDEDDFEGKE